MSWNSGRDLDLLTLGTCTLRTVGYGDTNKLDRPQDRALQQVMVLSGTVEKTRTERRQEKKKKKKEEKKEKGSSSDPAVSEVGDPSATPLSTLENNSPIYFQYAKGLVKLKMMVGEDFDARPGLTNWNVQGKITSIFGMSGRCIR